MDDFAKKLKGTVTGIGAGLQGAAQNVGRMVLPRANAQFEGSLPPTGSTTPSQQAPAPADAWWKQLGLKHSYGNTLTGSAHGSGASDPGTILGNGKNPLNGKSFVTAAGNRYIASTGVQDQGGKKSINLTMDPTYNGGNWQEPSSIDAQKDVVTHFMQTPEYQAAKAAGFELYPTGGDFGGNSDAQWYTMSPSMDNFNKEYNDLGTSTVSMANKKAMAQKMGGGINRNVA